MFEGCHPVYGFSQKAYFSVDDGMASLCKLNKEARVRLIK